MKRIILAAIILAALSTPAVAHSWYPWECCSDNDCAPLAAERVRETPAGYIVTVAPGEHPMWPAGRPAALTLTIAYGKARPSPDGQFHLCINGAGALLCFYAAIGGF